MKGRGARGGGITGSLANWLHRRKTSLYLALALAQASERASERAKQAGRKVGERVGGLYHPRRLKNAPLSLEFHRIHPRVHEWRAEQSHRKSPEWYSGLLAPSCTGCGGQAGSLLLFLDGERTLIVLFVRYLRHIFGRNNPFSPLSDSSAVFRTVPGISITLARGDRC